MENEENVLAAFHESEINYSSIFVFYYNHVSSTEE